MSHFYVYSRTYRYLNEQYAAYPISLLCSIQHCLYKFQEWMNEFINNSTVMFIVITQMV